MTEKKESVYSLLLKKYPDGQYALMAEVSDAAGYSRSRSADFIVVSLWPSRGLGIHGIELKSYRGDWLNEKKNPKKAENIFQYCDYFSLLTTDINIAKLDEIPDTWGWMNIENGRIKTIKEAPKQSPVALSRHFLAAMLKRSCDRSAWVLKESIIDEIQNARDVGRSNAESAIRELKSSYESLQKNVIEFEAESGIRINERRWMFDDPKKMGSAVKFIVDGGADRMKKDLELLGRRSKEIHDNIMHGIQLLDLPIKSDSQEQ